MTYSKNVKIIFLNFYKVIFSLVDKYNLAVVEIQDLVHKERRLIFYQSPRPTRWVSATFEFLTRGAYRFFP